MLHLRSLRPRAPRHSTIVAYIALILAMGSPAVAAALVGHAQLANNAVWSNNVKDGTLIGADVKDGTLTGADVKNGTLTGADIKPNSITGAQINEASLAVARVALHISGNQTVQAPQSPASAPYPLTGGTYVQPAHSSELYAGNLNVSWPAGCTVDAGSYRSIQATIFVDGKSVGSAYGSDNVGGDMIKSYQLLTIGGGFAVPTTVTRHVTAQVSATCGTSATSQPNVIGLTLDDLQFR
jgi:hypothetical protein